MTFTGFVLTRLTASRRHEGERVVAPTHSDVHRKVTPYQGDRHEKTFPTETRIQEGTTKITKHTNCHVTTILSQRES